MFTPLSAPGEGSDCGPATLSIFRRGRHGLAWELVQSQNSLDTTKIASVSKERANRGARSVNASERAFGRAFSLSIFIIVREALQESALS